MNNRVALIFLGPYLAYQEAEILNKNGLLERFYTDAYIGNKPFLRRILSLLPFKSRPLRGLLGRANEKIPADKIVSFDLFGLNYWFKKLNLKTIQERDAFYEKMYPLFNRSVIRNLPENISAVYSRDNASLELFQWARERGIKCILHQTIAPKATQRKIIFGKSQKYKSRLEEREKKEWALADLIVCASNFTRDSLIMEGADSSKCKLIPYSINLPNLEFRRTVKSRDKRIKVLFAGSVELRKGVSYLLEAVDRIDLRNFEILFVGQNNLPRKLVEKYKNKVRFLGGIPRAEMERIYLDSDILLFPSLCEGFGLVIPEAMNAGLPVISTSNTAAPEIIKHGREGFIIPIKDSAAIAKYLEILNKDRKLLYKMSCAAYKRAKQINPELYEKKLVREIKGVLSEKD